MAVAFDVMIDVLRRLRAVKEGDTFKASSGSTTTLVCAALTEADDYWNGGSLYITYDAGAAGAAPEKESAEITDFVAGTDTLTWTDTMSAAIAANDKFAIAYKTFPRQQIINAINNALRWLGDVPASDDTSLDTAQDTLEYTLPAAAVPDLRQVLVALNTSAPLRFENSYYWNVNRGAGKLVFSRQPNYVRDIRLLYMAPHAAVTDDDSAISANLPYDALVNKACADLLWWKMMVPGEDDRKWVSQFNTFNAAAEQARRDSPIQSIPKTPQLFPAPRTRSRRLGVADP